MSLKYVVNLLVLLAGGVAVASSLSFTAATAGWIAFAVGALAVALTAAAIAITGPRPRSVGYAVTAVIGIWSVVASLVFSGDTLTWLVFANALGLIAAALVDLTAHEVSTERVVHTLEVRETATA